MEITQFFRILWVRRIFVMVTMAAALLAAIAVIVLVPARYTAKSRVMLEIVKPDPVTGQMLSSQFARAFVTTQIELIKDYRVAGRVVDNFGWTGSPQLAAAYSASGVAGETDFRRWLSQRVVDGTEADLIAGSNILEISYTSNDPDDAATIADGLREAYEEETRLERQRTATRTADFFEDQTRKLRAQLAEAEKKKTDFERENGIVIDEDMTDTESARLRAMAGMTDMPAAGMVASGPIIAPSQAQLQQIDVAIEQAMRTLGPNHPRLVGLRQQRAATAQTVQRELSAARGASVSSGPSASQRYEAQAARVLAQRGKVAEGRQLAVDVSVLRDQAANAAKRTAELRQEAESSETGLSFLGSAVAPNDPSFPNIPMIIIGAVALGFALGSGLAILLELLHRKIRSPNDLVMLEIPMLGMAVTPPRGDPQLAWYNRLLPRLGKASQ